MLKKGKRSLSKTAAEYCQKLFCESAEDIGYDAFLFEILIVSVDSVITFTDCSGRERDQRMGNGNAAASFYSASAA